MDLDEASTAGNACRLHYESVRDSLLRAHPWNFARYRATLVEVLPVPTFGWAHRYQMPSDSLRILEVNGSDISLLANYWELEGDNLLSDAETMEIVYIRPVADPGEWDSLFREAMVLKLAMRLAETMRGGSGLDEKLAAEYDRMVAPLARRIDANESRPRESLLPWNSRFVNARGSAWGSYDPEISGFGLY